MEETTSKKKKPRLLYKREPDADDTYNALGGRAESSSSEDEGDGEELQLISKKLAKKFKFPPGCRVIFYEYEDSAAAGSLEVARMIKGVVSQIFVNAIQRDQPPSYEISFLPEPGQAATSLARKKETELRFAFKTPVWLSVDSEENNSEQQEAAVVGFEDVGSTVAYSVQLCYGDRRVYHGVQLGGRLKYRFEVTERKIEEEDHNQEYLESHVKDESKEDVPVPESGSDRSDQEKEKMPEETKNRTAVSPGPSSSATQNPKLPGEQIEDIAPDISVSPRRSSRMSTNTRKMPTEDQNEIPPTIATDESSSTGSASPLSGLDPSHEHDSNSNEQQTTSSESLDTPVPGNNQGNAVKVKTEADLHKTIAKKYRQYGDRCLLARQAKNANNTNAGMMKLGGGNQAMDLMPGPNNLSAQQKRKDEIGLVKAMAYCCQWNFNGPKYAGQRTAAVTCFPEDLKEGEAFSVFMKRSIGSKLFGWEYCGQYRPLIDDDILSHGTNARLLDQSIKDKMAQDIVKSLRQSNHGFFYERMLTWRRFITEEIEKYEGPKAPAWWVEKREPTDEEKKKYPYPKEIAARALALGFYNTISLEEFAKKIYVELDERYEEDIVEFVEYSEDMYNYVKDGESNRDAMGKSRTKKYSRKKIWNDSFDGECAKASDWYNKYDQHCFKSNQRLN